MKVSNELVTFIALSVITLTSSQSNSNDGWGPWSAPSECSRTCGVGVSFQIRRCLSISQLGIPNCVGSSKIYRTCNKQLCAEGTDYRKDQCQRYNQVTFEEKLYTWVPYYGGENPCELNCLAVGEKFYYRHAAKVVDGTPCGLNTPDICVDGACQMIGCDGELGSSMLWDKCHVCGGDGTTCKTLEGVVYTQDMTVGYNDVVLIPAGATSISIIEETASDSYLAIRTLSGQYLLNGDWHIDLPLPKIMAGATFQYERGSTPSAAPERVSTIGPISEAIFFVVLRQPRNNTSIRYEYSIPNEVKQDRRETYFWEAGDWQGCSATCGKGIKNRQVICRRSSNQEVVNPDLCDPHRKPEEKQECEIRGCPARWHTGEWGFCSTSCGGGVKTRPVYCRQQQDEVLHTIVDDSLCASNKPAMVQKCNENMLCPKWEAGEWSKCNRVCGEGEQIRSIICRSPVPLPNAISDILPGSRCSKEEQPDKRQTCTMGPCEGVDWVVSDWSGCSSTCEPTTETRHVVCSSKSLKMFEENMCDLNRKPFSSRPCPQSQECDPTPRWHASQWSKCSAKCGKGYQFRNVLCAKQEEADKLARVPEENCDADEKMNSTQNCYGEECAGLWFSGPWGKCSEPCGGGMRKREVLCFSGKGGTNTNDCSPNARPDATQDCNLESCDEDNLLVLGGCKGTRHGCCPDGIIAAEGPNYHGCPVKDPIPAGLCVETEFGCCPDGLTPAQGPFLADCPSYTCKNTLYGCCKDGQTPAGGPNGEQCPMEYGCDATAFGCCEDGVTTANGPDKEGCEVTQACRLSRYGCCPDGKAAAAGPGNAGCDVMESSGEVCEETEFGCCADKVTPAQGPNEQGCNEVTGCSNSQFGCCPDGVNAATDDNFAGCPGVVAEPSQSGCAFTVYGCCPNGEMAALGPNGEGCRGIFHVDCHTTTFGCCPDQETISLGPNYEGCSTGCEDTIYGCCQDGKTPSEGPNYEGCEEKIILSKCGQTVHGCCPDGTTAAKGPDFSGCNITRFEPQCDITTHGCCPDGQTVAGGPNFEGCSEEGSYELNCRETPYGCCADQTTPAQGPNQAGCPGAQDDSAACALPSETGPCRNFSVQWFYDAAVGSCNRFWYGGCDGNKNRFDTQEQCKATCVTPTGIAKCHLPKSVGTCSASTMKYFYNRETRTCEQFSYGGCQGNANRFESEEECRQECVASQAPDVCSQPSVTGPCRGGFNRWFYSAQAGQCLSFVYGGCKGNDNRFETKEACEARCTKSSTEVCSLPKVIGPCKAAVFSWYFSDESKQCEQFIYGGCRGNANRFPTREDCEAKCQDMRTVKEVDVCRLPEDHGPCKAYMRRWRYDPNTGYCNQFVYGGCQGNGNRFETEAECRQKCNARPPTDVCTLPSETGTCGEYVEKYFFDQSEGRCRLFHYGGCGGNGNNFGSLQECDKTCSHHVPQPPTQPTTVDRCAHPKDAGPCMAYLIRWYYNEQYQRCEQFIYGGCQGNRNRFLKMEECQSACMGEEEEEVTPVPDKEHTVDQDICSLEQDSGNCGAYLPKWYYNAIRRRCERFVYGGCDGNGNRFENQEDCERRCQGAEERQQPPVTEPPTSQPSTEPPTPAPVTGLAVCGLPSDAGPCRGSEPRWLYDIEEGRCKEFVYGGCRGNENNFQSREDCEAQCSLQEICQMEYKTGPCRAAKRRYFFDASVGQCRQFTYGGCSGNANRFLTMKSCESTCKRGGSDGDGDDNRIQPFPTSVLTPAPQPDEGGESDVADVCNQHYDKGPCDEYNVMFYYDTTHKICHHFVYGGCGGNTNRFESREACQKRCEQRVTDRPIPTRPPVTDRSYYPTSPHVVTEEVIPSSTVLTPSTPEPVTTSTQEPQTPPARTNPPELYRTPSTDYPHPESHHTPSPSAQPELETPDAPAQSEDVCQVEKDHGDCDDYTPVWYFEKNSKTCRRFLYGGCGGNGNRFGTRDECVASCINRPAPGPDREQSIRTRQPPTQPTTPPRQTTTQPEQPGDEEVVDICSLTQEVGPCQAFQTRWYFENLEGRCVQFNYGGCGANANNFYSEEDCRYTCGGPELEEENVDGDCFNPPDAGPCNNAVPRWFFDPSKGDCAPFYYGGCQGNGNNFHTYEDCLAMCSKVTLTCGVLQCDLQCSNGYARGLDGCPVCSCEDPCTYTQCAADETCQVEDDQAVCRPTPGCANTVYGCCPDGITPANDYNFRGCPEEEPSIDAMGKTEFMVTPGGDIILPCKARGAPRPQITWYKENFPLINLDENELLSQLADGSLHIRQVDADMASSFTCRAYNGIGEPATQTYRVTLEEEVGFLNTPSEITVRVGETAHLFCEVRGSPPPQRRWLRNEQEIAATNRVFVRSQRELIIMRATQADQGPYVCQANDQNGKVITKNFNLIVLGPLSVRIDAHNETYGEGAAVNLKCRTHGDGDIKVQWTKVDSEDITHDTRFLQTLEGDLTIRSSTEEDAGIYKCSATRGREVVSTTTVVRIEAGLLPENCQDKPWLANCQLIIEARLCKHPYFSNFCCRSCHEAGHLP